MRFIYKYLYGNVLILSKKKKKEKEITAGFINQIWIHLFLGSNSVQIWSGFLTVSTASVVGMQVKRDYIKWHHSFIWLKWKFLRLVGRVTSDF